MSVMPLKWLDPEVIHFPPPEDALRDPNGLLAIGGNINPQWLLAAYRRGVFPWYEENQPILWWCPDPRMVLRPGHMHGSRSLLRLARSGRYEISFDRSFDQVIEACAASGTGGVASVGREASTPKARSSTWITYRLQKAFQSLHRSGYAHSVEVWDADGHLAGGLYGLGLGRVFFGESMFSRQSNTSKLALWHLQQRLKEWNYGLIDCQVASHHLFSLGAQEIPRQEFLQTASKLLTADDRRGPWQ